MRKELLSLLESLEKTKSDFWNISRDTAVFISNIIKTAKYKTALEIGTSNGYSGIWIAYSLGSTGRLFTIESHKKGRYSMAQENFKKSGLKNITQILGHAPEVIPKTPKKFDFVFLDATKEEYILYFEALKNRLKKGGVIVADNIYSHPEPLRPFIAKIKNSPGWKVYEMNIGTGLLIGLRS